MKNERETKNFSLFLCSIQKLAFTLQLKVLYMSTEKKYLDDLTQIRSMMEKSTRFLSLSGLSGIFVGLVALIGAALAYYFYNEMLETRDYTESRTITLAKAFQLKTKLFLIAGSVLAVALLGGYYFTAKKAKKQSQKIWTKTSKDLLINLFVPLVIGGIFCLSLMKYNAYGFVAPAMLIFYGLALFGSSRYTFDEIRWLGLSEIALGLIAMFYLGHGLLFWTLGFGILHLLYGASMYFKYDYKK